MGAPAGADPNSSISISKTGALRTEVPEIDLAGDLGLVLIIGGTNVRWGLVDGLKSEPTYGSISWQEIGKDPEFEGKSLKPLADEVLVDIARRVRDFMEEKGVLPSQIKDFGVSIAGYITPKGNSELVSTVNTGPRFKKYDVLNQFLEAFNRDLRLPEAMLSPEFSDTINDGGAGVIGEHVVTDGALVNVLNGIFMIVGTGIGGGGISNGKLDRTITELGHTILFNEKSSGFEVFTLEELKKCGSFKNGKYLNAPDGYTYMETMLAGPWIAINLIKQFCTNQQKLKQFVDVINRRSKMEKAEAVEYDEIADIAALDIRKMTHWAVNTPSDVLKRVNRFLFRITSNDYRRCTPEQVTGVLVEQDRHYAELIQKAYDYKCTVLCQLGQAVGALATYYPNYKIVLGGGVCEAIGAEKNSSMMLEMIHAGARPCKSDKIVISRINAERRESGFIAARVEERKQRTESLDELRVPPQFEHHAS